MPDFVAEDATLRANQETQTMYNSAHASEIYRNFLDWLFASFLENELEFRTRLVARLQLEPGQRVLVTGCGLGEDLPLIAAAIGTSGALYAQDLSKSMVLEARRQFAASRANLKARFSVGDALALPFEDGFFDAVFHFGGINLFGDVAAAVREMARVSRAGGRIAFGDEGIAPWLKGTEYARIAITNNPLWNSHAPLELLPENCDDVHCTWVLGNCFYLIDLRVTQGPPTMNIDVPHKGRRGGTARTRFFGQLEGVDPDTRRKAIEAAARSGLSVHEWLERTLEGALKDR